MDKMDDLLRFFNMHWVFSIFYLLLLISLIWYRLKRKEDYIYRVGLNEANKDTPEARIDKHYVRFANFLILLFWVALPSLLWLVISFPAEGMLPPISDSLFYKMLGVMTAFAVGIHFIRPKRR